MLLPTLDLVALQVSFSVSANKKREERYVLSISDDLRGGLLQQVKARIYFNSPSSTQFRIFSSGSAQRMG